MIIYRETPGERKLRGRQNFDPTPDPDNAGVGSEADMKERAPLLKRDFLFKEDAQ